MSAGSEFRMSATYSDGVAVAVLTGEIDVASCAGLAGEFSLTTTR